MNELTIREENKPMKDSDILNDNFSFDDKIVVAEHVATSLANVIKTQNLAVNIQGNNYVTVDGWNTLGTMLGCSAIIEDVEDVTNIFGKDPREQVFKANVSIRKGDIILARASAIASTKKITKYGSMYTEPFVAYSMSQTRALGKCYRMALGWIMKMSGYESTPAEEMPTNLPKEKKNKAVRPKSKPVVKEAEVVEAEIVDVTPESATVVDDGDDDDVVVRLCKELKGKGIECRKAKILQLAKAHKCPDEVIEHIKTLKPEDFQKYDE